MFEIPGSCFQDFQDVRSNIYSRLARLCGRLSCFLVTMEVFVWVYSLLVYNMTCGEWAACDDWMVCEWGLDSVWWMLCMHGWHVMIGRRDDIINRINILKLIAFHLVWWSTTYHRNAIHVSIFHLVRRYLIIKSAKFVFTWYDHYTNHPIS